MPLEIALLHAVHCLDAESAAVLLESALETRRLTRSQVEVVLEQTSARRRRAIGRISPLAGSGSETRVRRFLERRGVKVREQVRPFGTPRVDLLVGDRLIIECDSWSYHGDREAYLADRSRDQITLSGGYLVLRLTWEDIWLHWERTQELLTVLIRQKTHRGPRVGRRNGSPPS